MPDCVGGCLIMRVDIWCHFLKQEIDFRFARRTSRGDNNSQDSRQVGPHIIHLL